MIETYNLGTIDFQWYEYFLIPSLLGIVIFVGFRVAVKNRGRESAYKFLVPALVFKLFAGLFFAFIYVFYYGGGDTVSYYSSTIPLVNLMQTNFFDYLDVLLHSTDITEAFSDDEWKAFTFNTFTAETGVPLSFISHDPKTFLVCKLTSPLLALAFKSYFACTILISGLTFIPMWRLYLVLIDSFPVLKKELAYTILFIPSVAFWGSGIMKDTYTFAATCLLVSSVYLLLKKRKIMLNAIVLIVSFFLILFIKPYIITILVPCIMIWVFMIATINIRNIIFKYILMPFLLVSGLIGSYVLLQSLGSSMDKFSLDQALTTAQITQDDLKREDQYGDNNFDIGELDGTIPNMLSKFPQATFAGLFRPMIFEARSPVMLFSGLENLVLLVLIILFFIKIKLSLTYQILKTTPFLTFCLLFGILFGYMIGITTPNFGALVRFKIPLLPFFASALIIIYSTPKIIESLESEKRAE